MRPTARVRVPLPQSGGKGAKVKDITAGAGEAQPDDPDEAENGELDEPLTASLPRSNSRQSSAGQNGSPWLSGVTLIAMRLKAFSLARLKAFNQQR
eukprot:6462163-Amphidinium_carterae.1